MQFNTLYREQRDALNDCVNHILGHGTHQHLIFGSSAGTGKTYSINVLRDLLNLYDIEHTAVAYTGRAASKIKARTCHSLLYEPVVDANGDLLRWARIPAHLIRENVGAGILVDEGSMIPRNMHDELTQIGVPIIYIGDYAQLPPVDASGDTFNVMYDVKGEHVVLNEMRRFGAESGIAEIATILREENSIPRIKRDDVKMVAKQATMKPEFFQKYKIDMVACGTNKTRKKYNDIIRRHLGYDTSEYAEIGEKVVCLRNDVIGGERISNGDLFTVIYALHENDIGKYILVNEDTKQRITVDILHETWITEKAPKQHKGSPVGQFAFGYAMTVHKLQGSSIENVLFYDENVSFFLDQQRFRYTGITRAAKQLYIAI